MPTLSRTVLVTGASSGIGRAVARRLLDLGHHVIGSSRDPSRFGTRHERFTPVALDLRNLDSLTAFANRLQREYPVLDAVVFAAGFGQFGGLEQFSLEQIQTLMTVNFTAQACLTRALLPKLKQKAHSNLIYIGSEAAMAGKRNGTIYCASKFALRGFAQALRDECGKTGVRVSLVNPGMVDTAFFDALSFMPGDQPGHALTADDVADAMVYILQAGPCCAVDEINLSPLSHVVRFKK